ncbi:MULTISPECIES: hypothetical protein [unclassified Gilliamella]|uniref:hypothetical protein n=1 Tax=unclassified Gilliamella TaxID=2685620 RepID=UPI00130D0FBC|nr:MULTISPECIES: hypothetical protein [unclassified Gilliamella]MWP50271.1 hypothetical protein [Gilliamella sp. Lep-s35]MWP69617.1 hypothetical protein [Gilliamella sp. Lep-s5]MWP77892.1 hypothetical protein [Gilliamella sp. Lep-s21]
MNSLLEKIHAEYKVLYENGFKDAAFENNGSLFSSVNCINQKTGFIFNFTVEKGMLSISLSTEDILTDKSINKYDKYFDVFYLVKLLNPSINFNEITPSIYSSFIHDNFNKLLLLFDKKNICKTIKEVNEISKKYNKLRWK